jgi:sterol desaturase/sphingolipid hydroxylase (fatty acid hydroxylase superfamily)
MAAPGFLVDAAQGWARVYADHTLISAGVMFVHLTGLLLGGGAAVAADRQTLKAAREPEPVRADHLAFLGTVHGIAVTGLAMLAVSGIAMLLADLETFWTATAFWIKMGLVALLLANGLLVRLAERRARARLAGGWRPLTATAMASLLLWLAIVLASTILASE